MATFVKTTNRLTVKFVQESTSDIILEVPTTPLELHDYFKADFITSVLRNTFGENRLKEVGNVVLVIDVNYQFKA